MSLSDVLAPDEPAQTVRMTFADSDGPDIDVRPILLGLSPAIYIEPVVEDGEVVLDCSFTDLDPEQGVALLRMIADTVETAQARRLAAQSDDADEDED